MHYRFGHCEMNLVLRQLTIDGVVQDIGGRAFDLLAALVEHRERVVSTRELFRLVWPDAQVQHNNLRVQIWTLRRLLGPATIVTVARRGYCFSAEVEILATETDPGVRRAGGAVQAPETPAMTDTVDAPEAPGWAISVGDVCDALAVHRLVTLVGADEAGRQHLAQAVAAHLSSASAAVWWLAARSLQAGWAEPEGALSYQVGRLCREASAVLVVQNCHLADPGLRPVVQELLERHDRLRVLATSAAALGLPAEKALWTRPMVSPVLPGAFGVSRAASPPALEGLRWRGRGRA